MRSILTQLAEGKLPFEPRFFKPDSPYGRMMGILAESEDKLLSILNEEEQKLFKEFYEAQEETNRLSRIEQFTYGYRLGALMTTEVFMGTGAFAAEGRDGANE